MDKEIWRPIPEYENRYEVSNWGRVRSLKNHHGTNLNQPIIRKTKINRQGYFEIGLKVHQKQKFFKIHRLVAQAFIPNANDLPQVNHIDGNKQNNRADNLEWVTQSENIRHALDNGLSAQGANRSTAKLTSEQVKQIRKDYIFRDKKYSAKKLAEKYNVTPQTIWLILHNKTYKNID